MSKVQERSKVRVVNCDWAKGIGQHTATVVNMWNDGRCTWCKVRWNGTNSNQLAEKFGVNFNLDELRTL